MVHRSEIHIRTKGRARKQEIDRVMRAVFMRGDPDHLSIRPTIRIRPIGRQRTTSILRKSTDSPNNPYPLTAEGFLALERNGPPPKPTQDEVTMRIRVLREDITRLLRRPSWVTIGVEPKIIP